MNIDINFWALGEMMVYIFYPNTLTNFTVPVWNSWVASVAW